MEKISMTDIENIVDTYGNVLFRLCLIMLGNAYDAEDAVQETLIKYLQKAPNFKDKEHEKAWLIKVAANKCKDMLRFRTRHMMAEIESIKEFSKDDSGSGRT